MVMLPKRPGGTGTFSETYVQLQLPATPPATAFNTYYGTALLYSTPLTGPTVPCPAGP
jgi:hypothetical protein